MRARSVALGSICMREREWIERKHSAAVRESNDRFAFGDDKTLKLSGGSLSYCFEHDFVSYYL